MPAWRGTPDELGDTVNQVLETTLALFESLVRTLARSDLGSGMQNSGHPSVMVAHRREGIVEVPAVVTAVSIREVEGLPRNPHRLTSKSIIDLGLDDVLDRPPDLQEGSAQGLRGALTIA